MSVSHGWHVIGLVDIREPGSYEILFQNGGVGVGIRRVDSSAGDPEPMVLDAEGVAHHCTPCACCGECGCSHPFDGRAMCGACAQYSRWAAETRPLLDDYLAAVGSKDAFVETNGRTHSVGCPSLKRNINDASDALTRGCTHRQEWYARVPEVLGPEAPRRKRCAVCCPDVIVPTSAEPVRGMKGRFAAQQAPSAG
ncbi:hypothetical protein [Micromonospora aurantiaca (nom. illeg.)]|uniref:hypothetical protein n=1 Tax=Micromonospora aurantiaca (nom. illeg.) TaxID=47850 RepID=UPI0036611C18